jgi:hypothetical protein
VFFRCFHSPRMGSVLAATARIVPEAVPAPDAESMLVPSPPEGESEEVWKHRVLVDLFACGLASVGGEATIECCEKPTESPISLPVPVVWPGHHVLCSPPYSVRFSLPSSTPWNTRQAPRGLELIYWFGDGQRYDTKDCDDTAQWMCSGTESVCFRPFQVKEALPVDRRRRCTHIPFLYNSFSIVRPRVSP